MPRWPRIVFCIIWIFFALGFAVLTYEAYKAKRTTLSRFSITFPNLGTVQIMGVDLPEILTEMSEITNKNIAMLEDSIRRSSSTSFWLNFVSCWVALAGFIAQIAEYLKERRSNDTLIRDVYKQ